jgi:hypothetical protein
MGAPTRRAHCVRLKDFPPQSILEGGDKKWIAFACAILFVLTASISEASAVVWARGVTSALCRYRTSALPVSREILDRHAMVLAARILRRQAIEKEHLVAIG